MDIRKSDLKKILFEEIQNALHNEAGIAPEHVLDALEILAEAHPGSLKSELPILEELVLRIKNS